MRYKDDLSYEYVSSRLYYDSTIGSLIWKNGRRAGRVAGCCDARGYVVVKISGGIYKAHRLIWLLMHNKWPDCIVDHKDLDKGDNHMCSLRPATYGQSVMNRPTPKNNTSGAKGVSHFQNAWRARIGINGKQVFLGYFDTREHAVAAYCKAAAEYHGKFARTE